jgi:flagellar motor switch/type III secretory pathway protein FliN
MGATMTAQPFRLYGETELARVHERLRAALRAWAEEWLAVRTADVGAPAPPVSLEALQARSWLTANVVGETLFGVGRVPYWQRALAELLAGVTDSADAGESPLASRIEHRLLRALAEGVASQGGIGGALEFAERAEPPTADLARPGSGYLSAVVRYGDTPLLEVLLAPPLALRLAGATGQGARRSEGLTARRQALGAEPVVLEVQAGSAELALADLQTLAVGDVLRLDRTLREPLAITVATEGTVCLGHLGLLHGRKAVQLVASSSTDKAR